MTTGRRDSDEITLAALLRPLIGTRVPGGCEDCNAEQTVRQDSTRVWIITVEHDPTCPTLAAYERKSKA